MVRQAVKASVNGSCSLTIAKLSSRKANGDFNRLSGRAFSMMRSIALWKCKEKNAVRPIGIGEALKGIMTRAHCDQVRTLVADFVEKDQLGMMKSGYETGVHAMRALAKQCEKDDNVIFIFDFSNAYNDCYPLTFF